MRKSLTLGTIIYIKQYSSVGASQPFVRTVVMYNEVLTYTYAILTHTPLSGHLEWITCLICTLNHSIRTEVTGRETRTAEPGVLKWNTYKPKFLFKTKIK